MFLRRICLAATLTTFAAEPALALRCSSRSIGYAYAEARNNPGKVLVEGRITVEEAVNSVPEHLDESHDNGTLERTVPGHFEGHMFSGTSFDSPLVTSIGVMVICIGQHCGETPDDTKRKYLLARDSETDALTLKLYVCTGMTYWPSS